MYTTLFISLDENKLFFKFVYQMQIKVKFVSFFVTFNLKNILQIFLSFCWSKQSFNLFEIHQPTCSV